MTWFFAFIIWLSSHHFLYIYYKISHTRVDKLKLCEIKSSTLYYTASLKSIRYNTRHSYQQSDLLCLSIYYFKCCIASDYEIARAIEALAILLDIQLSTSWDVIVGTARDAAATKGCVVADVVVTATPKHARFVGKAKILRSPFFTIT